jgi:hypothetical protein
MRISWLVGLTACSALVNEPPGGSNPTPTLTTAARPNVAATQPVVEPDAAVVSVQAGTEVAGVGWDRGQLPITITNDSGARTRIELETDLPGLAVPSTTRVSEGTTTLTGLYGPSLASPATKGTLTVRAPDHGLRWVFEIQGVPTGSPFVVTGIHLGDADLADSATGSFEVFNPNDVALEAVLTHTNAYLDVPDSVSVPAGAAIQVPWRVLKFDDTPSADPIVMSTDWFDVEVPITGSMPDVIPLRAATATVDLGRTSRGSLRTVSVPLFNDGDHDIRVTGIDSNPAFFMPSPVLVPAHGTADAQVTFQPDGAGAYDATIKLEGPFGAAGAFDVHADADPYVELPCGTWTQFTWAPSPLAPTHHGDDSVPTWEIVARPTVSTATVFDGTTFTPDAFGCFVIRWSHSDVEGTRSCDTTMMVVDSWSNWAAWE